MEIDRACLRRDAYLDRVLAHESKKLREEIPSPNSPEARRFLQEQLQSLDRVPVNLSLSPSTIESVNETCKDLNLVRDCFINRVLFFLVVADLRNFERFLEVDLSDYLPDMLSDLDREALYAPLWNGGLKAIAEIVNGDPFWTLRNAIEWAREQDEDLLLEPLHACVIVPSMFPKKVPGVMALNCYLPDEYVPGTRAAEQPRPTVDEILGLIDDVSPDEAKEKGGEQ